MSLVCTQIQWNGESRSIHVKTALILNMGTNMWHIHALWFLRVPDSKPVLKHKGFFGVFEYSSPLFFRKSSTCS